MDEAQTPKEIAKTLNGAAEKLKKESERHEWLIRILGLCVLVGLVLLLAMGWILLQFDDAIDSNTDNINNIQESTDSIEEFVDQVRAAIIVVCQEDPQGFLCDQEGNN